MINLINALRFLQNKDGTSLPSSIQKAMELANKLYGQSDPVIDGDLKFSSSLVGSSGHRFKLPNNLTVKGSVELRSREDIVELPDNLFVEKHLLLGGTRVSVLPKSLTVLGDLFAQDRDVLEVSCAGGDLFAYRVNNLTITEDCKMNRLIIKDSGIRLLPDNLKINWLNASNCKWLTKFPTNLTCQYVNLDNSDIQDVPYNLSCFSLDCKNTPLSKKYTPEEIKALIQDRGGEVQVVRTD